VREIWVARVHVRVGEQVKTRDIETMASLGLSLSEAVRVFLMRVIADKLIPFTISLPNAETRSAITQADEISR
jgi:DNA-damage-inducible protein J